LGSLDHDEDLQIGAANINLEEGHLPNGEHRNLYYPLVIVSLDTAAAVTVCYYVKGDAVKRRIVLAPAGGEFRFAQPPRIICGTGENSDAALVKLMWKDRKVYDGEYGGRTRVTVRP